MEKPNSDGFTAVLLAGESSSRTLERLFHYKKAVDPRFSLAFITKRIGFSSRGTLSETIKGRRRLARRYWKPLAQVIGLDNTQAELLIAMFERDECESEAEKTAVQQQIEGLRLFLKQRFFEVELYHGLSLLASDVLCYFGTLREAPGDRQIIDFFGKSRSEDIRRALHVLCRNGLLEKREGLYYRCEKTKPFLSYEREVDFARACIAESIQDAGQQMRKWIERPQEACFGSTTMSVKKEHYEEVLLRLRKDMLRYFSELETEEGDSLIRFNLQVYPIEADRG